jgi:hypothetical protein
VDAFTVAAELLGDLQLTSGQLAQLRALNHNYWHTVAVLLHPADDDERSAAPPAAEPSLSAQQTADLRAMLERDVRRLLTPEQREELG